MRIDIFEQRRQRARVGECAETGAEKGMIADIRDLRLPYRAAAGELGGVLEHARDCA